METYMGADYGDIWVPDHRTKHYHETKEYKAICRWLDCHIYNLVARYFTDQGSYDRMAALEYWSHEAGVAPLWTLPNGIQTRIHPERLRGLEEFDGA